MIQIRLVGAASVAMVLVLGGCAGHQGETAAKETPVTMDELPAPVRATLEKESTGGKVTEIEKEVKKGKTLYSADMKINGVEWDITIAEDGTVVSKEKE